METFNGPLCAAGGERCSLSSLNLHSNQISSIIFSLHSCPLSLWIVKYRSTPQTIHTRWQVTVQVKPQSTADHNTGTTTITTVASSNLNSNNNNTTITALNSKNELPGTTTIQITSNQSLNNSNTQQVCLESMQLNDVDVRTNFSHNYFAWCWFFPYDFPFLLYDFPFRELNIPFRQRYFLIWFVFRSLLFS